MAQNHDDCIDEREEENFENEYDSADEMELELLGEDK